MRKLAASAFYSRMLTARDCWLSEVYWGDLPALWAVPNEHSKSLVSAAPSERARPTWLQLFYGCVCVTTFSSLSCCASQIFRTKPYRMGQGCYTAHPFWGHLKLQSCPHDICFCCFKLLNLYSLSSQESKTNISNNILKICMNVLFMS